MEVEGEAIEIGTGRRLPWNVFLYILLAVNRMDLDVSFVNNCSLKVCISS